METAAIGTNSISAKSSQASGNFSEMRTIQPEILDIREQSLGIHRQNAVPFGTGSSRKFKPDVLIE